MSPSNLMKIRGVVDKIIMGKRIIKAFERESESSHMANNGRIIVKNAAAANPADLN